MQIVWKRGDPFDASDAACTAQVGRQGDDSVPRLAGKRQEGGVGQRAVAVAVSLVGYPHCLDQLELASGQDRTDFGPPQNRYVAITHGWSSAWPCQRCASGWSCQRCAMSAKCSATHSSE